ncbi:hypothetical protein C2134_00700 [Chromobacterium sinusclupearum]|uniref:Uncharacterized protein n=1 Tax=Chromobacterium sinusclupearum TaxID=2077146 RepID=A0A2K4MU25_9NEIS|nr:hypothetical protein C2134_00700 [Chromobacterium sinusclupearum]
MNISQAGGAERSVAPYKSIADAQAVKAETGNGLSHGVKQVGNAPAVQYSVFAMRRHSLPH